MPFFKSVSIKCQCCNHIFWAVQITAVLSLGHRHEDFFFFVVVVNSFYLIERSDMLFSTFTGLFYLWLTVVS